MRRSPGAAAVVALTTVGLLSCDHSATAPRLDQLTLDVVSGNGQTGVVGTELAPLVVKVTSGGNPVAGQILNFRVVAGGGSVYGGTELTDNDGIAQELWTLGTSTAAEQQVEVRAVESSTGAAKVFATFTATALPGPAAQIVIQAGNGQTAHPLSSVPIAPAVQVADQYGNPVNLPNVTVNFTPDDAGGRVTNGRATTGPNGVATVGSWTLGSTCGGTNTLTATATGSGIAGNPATFTARGGDCWTTQAPMSTARLSLGVAMNNGILYAIGGNDRNNDLGTVEAYHPATDTWTTQTPMPTARRALGVATVNGTIYAIGGVSNAALATVEAYDPATDTWTTKAPMPAARWDIGVAVINGVIYAVGGFAQLSCNCVVATVEAYDPATDTWTTKAPMPTARTALAVGVVNGILYAVGGDDVSGSTVATVEAYDPTANAWTTKASMPTATVSLGGGVANGILYAVGGTTISDAGVCLATTEAYDPATDTWTTKASMPSARERLGVAVITGILYAVGGYKCDNGSALATNEAYQP